MRSDDIDEKKFDRFVTRVCLIILAGVLIWALNGGRL